ncbi:50S ribosomal protein L23 [Patescibacteria group bacterium]|nr:50S ribosomal protein L23 [Patescibacteria group bacterium]
MALFGSKKNTKKVEEKAVVAKTETSSHIDLSHVIVRPRITEKASMKAEKNVYAFEVSVRSDKKSISAAVKALYNVTPVKVAIVAIPTKEVFVRGKWGIKKGGKKAYVYLKKGETIEFV